jgi:predicted transcriptional regulator
VRATRIASLVGQVLAVVFVGVGLWQNAFTLALIGFFVFTTARSENTMVQLDAMLKRFKAKDLMRVQFTPLQMNDWMQTPIAMLQQGLERHFLVVDFADEPTGYLDEESIMTALKKRDLSANIASYARTGLQKILPEESLQYIYYLIRYKNFPIVAVIDDNEKLIGVIDETGLDNFLKMQSRMK